MKALLKNNPIENIIDSFDYTKPYNKIKELKKQTELSDILEIGCYLGVFVEILRDLGYNALGTDINTDLFSSKGIEEGYLIHPNEIYNDKNRNSFDLIMAHRVMSEESTIIKLMLEHGMIIDLDLIKEDCRKKTKENNQSILEISFKLLKPGKYFIATETYGDKLSFDEQFAKEIGYKVIKYDFQNLVLQK